MKKLSGVVCVLMVCLALAGPAWGQAQITSGTIQGDVVDEKAGVVPGATVEIRNLDTNLTRTQTTGEDGRFAFLLLPPGRYTVTISKAGFATIVQENVNLTVGQAFSLPVTMKVSAVEERIVVTATPVVDLIKTESSTTLNQVTVGTTPILGRKFEDLLTLTPGVSIVQGPDGDEINFHGQRGMFNNISLDGGDYNNGFFGEQVGGQRAAIDITLDAVKEFQVVAAGSSAEFGRTAGGVVNVITKSGTNDVHGSLFHFQRLEALSANTSDGKPLKDFRREQFGGTIGGPIQKDRTFFFFAAEQIFENLQRPNLSEQIGSTACPSTPTIRPSNSLAVNQANAVLINGNPDCQRVALLNFYETSLNQREGDPVKHTIGNTNFLTKLDTKITEGNLLSGSFSINRSRNENQTFDVPTYGNSANGIEGASFIYSLNINLFSTISPTLLNEGHFTYLREKRPREATKSNVPPDTGAGFSPSFRFGNPYFLQPTVEEVFWRTQIRDNVSWVRGKHNIKFGGEWIHSLNDQTFRGFFTARYLFDSVVGFLRYASPTAPNGFGRTTAACDDGTFVTVGLGQTCSGDSATFTGGPLLFYLQNGTPSGAPNVPPPGRNKSDNEDFALFIQDKWQIWPNFTLNYGLRWEAQLLANPIVPASQTAYAFALSNPRFPSDGTIPDQWKMFQPRVGFAWDFLNNRKSVLRAHYGIYNARQNMLSQVGSITDNGVQQRGSFVNTGLLLAFGATTPTYPGILPPAPASTCSGNPFPCFTGVRVFDRDYDNPRIYTTNVSYEHELFRDTSIYFDFTHAKGVHLTRFVSVNIGDAPTRCCAISNNVQILIPGTGDAVFYSGAPPFGPQLGDVFTTRSTAKALYRGFTVGMRKRFSNNYQLEWNYTYSRDRDDDSSERDPFVDRTFNRFDPSLDYAPSDRDIRHKFNFITYAELPWGFQGNARIQARSAQPVIPSPRVLNNVDRGRNSTRKDNEFFSFDWRLLRPFKFGERYAIVPMVEMFNTFNTGNNINPFLTNPCPGPLQQCAPSAQPAGLFNFDGFLRQGVGDPLQVQFAVRFTF